MFYGAEVKTMMPKLHSANFEGIELIRPLYYVKEEDIISWANFNGLKFINCACNFTEKIENNSEISKRKEIKDLISKLKKSNRDVDYNIFKSLDNVNLNCALGYCIDGKKHSFLDEYDKKW
jgi:tRNA(Ile)-lysidine synthase TilS/MesJ